MPTVKIESTNVLKAFYNADASGKQLLKDLVNGQVDFNIKVTDRVKSFEDACVELGIVIETALPYPKPVNNRQEYANACVMLDIISESLSEGIVLDWANNNQKKWYPWFNEYKSGSGFRFCESNFNWSNANTSGGARLCLPTKELADYFGQQFLPIWNKFLNPIK